MKGKCFVDTNFMVYLLSKSEPVKRKHCSQVLDQINRKGTIVWSTQIVQELYNVLTKKHALPLMEARDVLLLFEGFELVTNGFSTILDAIDLQSRYQYSFWDSLVLTSAIFAKCNYVISEDMHHGQVIQGMEIINPFKLDSLSE